MRLVVCTVYVHGPSRSYVGELVWPAPTHRDEWEGRWEWTQRMLLSQLALVGHPFEGRWNFCCELLDTTAIADPAERARLEEIGSHMPPSIAWSSEYPDSETGCLLEVFPEVPR